MSAEAYPGTGLGFDAHRFAPGRPLILGGVRIEYDMGLAGHSDADVLCHAAADAVLGAAGLGDLGEHFPSTDSRWKDASSLGLLQEVRRLLRGSGLVVEGVDSVVIAERPRLGPYRQGMTAGLAGALEISPDKVSVKVTSTDGMGFTGSGEGVAAMAVARVGPRL